MTTRMWIGGGDNNADNPANWSTTGAPQLGDILTMSTGTMNVAANSLAGNTLSLVPLATAPFDAAINLNNSSVSLDIGQNFAMQANGAVATRFGGGNGVGLSGSVELNSSSLVMTGGVSFAGEFDVGGKGRIINAGTVDLTNSKIGSDVYGTGIFDLASNQDGPGNTEILGSVGSGLTFDLQGAGGSNSANLTIDSPFAFQALIEVRPPSLPDVAPGGDTVTLAGLSATSYTYSNDILTLFDRNDVVTSLRLDSTLSLSVVQNTPVGVRPSISLDFGSNDPHTGLPIHQSQSTPTSATPTPATPTPVTAPAPISTPAPVATPVTASANPPAPTPVATPAPGDISGFDSTTDQSLAPVAQPYTGPVPGLQHEFISVTPDNLNITAATPDWFMHTGSGNDALTASSGTNVLDGGTGSNFLTGGTGTDTFFVDDRGPTGDIWSTVVGFHAGDVATVWGVTPQDFSVGWVDGQGASGFTGLTLHATASGLPTASLTLAGLTQADVSSGRLSVSYGSDPTSGSAYMTIQGNS